MSYKIIRFFQNDELERRIIKHGLTLEEAQAHCQDKETSSKTATTPEAVALTEEVGDWFDGYDEDKEKGV